MSAGKKIRYNFMFYKAYNSTFVEKLKLNVMNKNTFLKIVTPVAFSFMVYACNGQPMRLEQPQKIKWLGFEEAVAKSEKEPKKMFVDVYTNWCGWCKKMDATTFMDDKVADYMNKNFYPVKFNAESKDTIHFKGTNFVFKPEFKSNELAISLLNKQMSYPTYVFLDEQFNLLAPVQGFMPPEGIIPVLTYFGENIYKTKTWQEYQPQPAAAPAATPPPGETK